MLSQNSVVELHNTVSSDDRWSAVNSRDARADGQFVYAVTSTRVFCRPSCPSRRPRRDRVRFFDSPAAASQAGFRACRRCRPTEIAAHPPATLAVHRASRYLAQHADQPVTLATLAKVAGLSAFYLQRQFKKALGLSPREFQSACRAEEFRRQLQNGGDVTRAIHAAGYGSPSRVYATAPTGRGMRPSDYRRAGRGMAVGFITAVSEIGALLVAATAIGICAVKLGDSPEALEEELRREFREADVVPGRFVNQAWLAAILARLAGGTGDRSLPLDVRGTAFQWRVWRALQEVPVGETRSYAEVAAAIGQPTAVRAVARACATNPVCLLIPCHRVVGKDGSLGGYRWGAGRKRQLLNTEEKLEAK